MEASETKFSILRYHQVTFMQYGNIIWPKRVGQLRLYIIIVCYVRGY